MAHFKVRGGILFAITMTALFALAPLSVLAGEESGSASVSIISVNGQTTVSTDIVTSDPATSVFTTTGNNMSATTATNPDGSLSVTALANAALSAPATSGNLILNPGFELAGATAKEALNWLPYGSGYERVAGGHSGSWSIRLANTNGSQQRGAYERIDLNQTEAKPVFIGGFVKGSNIVNRSGYFGASLYAEIHLKDGTTKYWNTVANLGTFGWRWIGFNTGTLTLDGVNKFIDQPISYVYLIPILASATGAANFDDIAVYEITPAEPAVTLMFDDGEASIFTAAKPELAKYNFGGSAAIITNYVGRSGFMTWANLTALQTGGWEIVSHSRTHKDLTLLTGAQINSELSTSKTALASRGLKVNNFAIPFGAYNADILARSAQYYRSARPFEQGFNAQGTYPFDVKVKGVVLSTTVDQVGGWLDEAKTRKEWLVLVFHGISDAGDDNYHTTPAVFSAMVKAVADSQIPVVTYDQGLDKFVITQ